MTLAALVVLALASPQQTGLYGADTTVPERTAVTIDGVTYGAEGNDRGPIGGGPGYADVVTAGDRTVRDLDSLTHALATAEPGEVVFVPGDVTIDLTAACLIDGLVLEIPAGVTLASDRGHGGSPGALLFSDHLATRPLIRVTGDAARVSGLRLRGPDPERRLDHHRRSFRGDHPPGRTRYYALPTSDGIRTRHDRLRIDNCELAGWSHAAIDLRGGDGHLVQHCFIHHNQRQGLGYGICHDVAFSTIERNLFDWNRHSIAGTGRPGSGYVARHNVERGTSLSHLFDMHGGRDRKDGTDVAGTRVRVERNTFLCERTAVVIRGVPEDRVDVLHNWAVHAGPAALVRAGERTIVGPNAFGLGSPRVILP